MNKLYWVGTRQSDIEDTGNLFSGSVTIFGDNCKGNISYCSEHARINHNIPNKECDLFFIKTLESLCKKDNEIRFVFYNQMAVYQYSDIIRQHTICLNPYTLLEKLSNKCRSRTIVKNIINTLPYTVLNGSECSYKNICNYFVGYDEFVIQKSISSGGEGTFHINNSSDLSFITPNEEYLISPYIQDAISLNAHIIISEKNVLFLPPSIQIITEIENKLLYCGADFICYKSLPDDVISKIENIINRLGKFIQQQGYKGILGIDLILKEKQIYFMEFNTRFQASSHLINKSLYSQQNISLQELNLQAFEMSYISDIKLFEVNYSSYIYTTSNITKQRLKKIVLSDEIAQVQNDGFLINDDIYPHNDNVYLNRCIFSRNICSINKKVVLHPNIYVENIKSFIATKNPRHKEYVKIALLNHGITLSTTAIQLATKYGKIKEAVFDAIDIIIYDKLHVNVPCNCKFNSISPFTIEAEKDKFILLCDGENMSEVDIYFVPDTLLNKKTKSGIPYDSIINLATDRIRINPAPVCYYKQHKLQCKFCNLPDYNEQYNLIDIIEIIDYCLENVQFRHFLIGGGTYGIDEKSWNIIGELASYIRKKSDKDIYLMSIPPKEIQTLEMLKNAGITEVAFNLEIFDRELAKACMPGKGMISSQQYISILKHAVSLWGNDGMVRSLLIYGFDTDKDFLNGIEDLCKLGIEPIISIFRPLNGTEFSELNPPATLDVFSIYNKCQKIVKKYSMILGPDCPKCQNNTLSFTEIQ